ncbi:hypothetical protein HDK64DRAFT_265134 [Phyllosticta capitalensis]
MVLFHCKILAPALHHVLVVLECLCQFCVVACGFGQAIDCRHGLSQDCVCLFSDAEIERLGDLLSRLSVVCNVFDFGLIEKRDHSQPDPAALEGVQ